MARVVGRPRFLSAFFIFPSMVFFFLRADEFPGLGMYGASSPISSSLAPPLPLFSFASPSPSPPPSKSPGLTTPKSQLPFPPLTYSFLSSKVRSTHGLTAPCSSYHTLPHVRKMVRYALDGGNRLGGVNEVVVAR